MGKLLGCVGVFFFQAEDGIRDKLVTGVQTCALPISLGVELKKNIKERWWRSMVHDREDIEGLDAAILMHPKVWEASGHVSGFTDPLVDCKQCKNRFRADDPRIKGTPGEPTAQCPVCGSKGTLTAPRLFNQIGR